LAELPVFESFVKMNGVSGPIFNACSFVNSKVLNAPNSIINYGIGIDSYDSKFEVNGSCSIGSSPCNGQLTRTIFDGLGYGVSVKTIQATKPFIVKECLFSNCYVGLYNSTTSFGSITQNQFNLGKLPFINTSVPELDGKQYGVFFENNISGFTLSENSFSQVVTSSNTNLTLGTVAKNLGFTNNTIDLNQYQSINRANYFEGINSNSQTPPISGLLYLCNQQQFNANDIIGGNLGRIKYEHGKGYIDPNSGNPSYLPAGNTFSSTGCASNAGCNIFIPVGSIKYYYNDQLTGQTPVSIKNAQTFVSSNAPICATPCFNPPCLTTVELPLVKGEYYEHKSSTVSAIIAYNAAIASNNIALANQKSIEADFYNGKMYKAAYQVVEQILYDTIGFSQDSLNLWLGNLNAPAQNYLQTLQNSKDGQYKLESFFDNRSTINGSGDDEMLIGNTSDLRKFHKLILGSDNSLLSESDMNIVKNTSLEDYGLVYGLFKNLQSLNGKHYAPSINPIEPNTELLHEKKTIQNVEFVCYPNPASRQLVFEWNPKEINSDRTFQISIFDSFGRHVYDGQIEGRSLHNVDVSKFVNGIYHYSISNNREMLISNSVIIQH
jgi:hypothetical protein